MCSLQMGRMQSVVPDSLGIFAVSYFFYFLYMGFLCKN